MNTHSLSLVSAAPETTQPHLVIKQCKHCNKPFTVDSSLKRRGRQRVYCKQNCAVAYHCKHVRCKETERQRMSNYYIEKPELRFLASTKQLAKERRVAFDLDAAWIKERLDKGVCEVTGLPIKIKQYSKGKRGGRGFFSPSIDRINNSVGYIPSNCRLVAWGYNLCKNEYTDREVNALALAILIQSIPKAFKAKFLKSLPNILLATLPSGHTLF